MREHTYRQVAHAFSGKAGQYENHAAIQQQLIDALVQEIEQQKIPSGAWLDIGAGTGLFEKSLPQACLPECIVGADIAAGSLGYAHETVPGLRPVVADMHLLPFRKTSFSNVVMTSALQWTFSPSRILDNIREVLIPGGFFCFTVFLKGYLSELATVYRDMGADLEVYLPSQKHFEDLLLSGGLSIIRSKRIRGARLFPTAFDVIKHLVAIGATARKSGSVHRSVFEICRRYSRAFATPQGVPLSFDALVGIATTVSRKESREEN